MWYNNKCKEEITNEIENNFLQKKIKKELTNSTVSDIIKIQRKNRGLKVKATKKVQKNKKGLDKKHNICYNKDVKNK